MIGLTSLITAADSGDSAAWTAAGVAIVAACLSLIPMFIAKSQAKSAKDQADEAKRSADISEHALLESRAQTAAAQKAAAAAEQQVEQARRQNEITEEHLEVARAQIEADQQRQHRQQTIKHVGLVHTVLRAAAAVRDELKDHVNTVYDELNRPISIRPPIVLLDRQEQRWNEAVDAVRVDRPPAPAVNAAIERCVGAVRALSSTVDPVYDLGQESQSSENKVRELADMVTELDEAYEQLTRACNDFFAASGVNPNDLTAD